MTDKILWLTPETAENISVGRQRIAEGLRDRNYSVDQRQWSARDSIQSLHRNYDVTIATTHAGAVMGLPTTLTSTRYIIDHVDPLWKLRKTQRATITAGIGVAERVAFGRADGLIYVYDDVDTPQETQTRQTTLGVDYERFQEPPTNNRRIVRDWLIDENVPNEFAIYIGGFEERYNLETVLAAAQIRDIPLVLAGDGSQRDMVENAAGQSDSITYLGSVKHELIPALLNRASVGVCLVDDPHTVKVLEYGAAGLPIVHLDGRARGVLPESGIEWTDNSIQSVIGALERALTDEPNTDELDAYAQARTWNSVVDDYEAMLNDV